jgi:hypothetical protein
MSPIKTFILFGCISAGLWSPIIIGQEVEPPPGLILEKVTPEIIAQYSDTSPELKYLYEQLFIQALGRIQNWKTVVSNDLDRRGSNALPILLKSFVESKDGVLRYELLEGVHSCLAVPMEPFVEAIRDIWKKEGPNTHVKTCYGISFFLSRFGEAEDEHILEEMQNHPDGSARSNAKVELKYMEKRLNGKLQPSEWNIYGRTPKGYDWGKTQVKNPTPAVESATPVINPALVKVAVPKEAAKVLPAVNTGNDSSWIVWLLAVFAGLCGVFWLLRKPSKQV